VAIEVDRNAKGRRNGSLQALEQIYYVIAGLAFTNALTEVNRSVPQAGTDASSAHLPLFVLFVSIAVRFVHGASTHFGIHKLGSEATTSLTWYVRFQPLIDFLGFGAQASLFVVLTSKLSTFENFFWWLKWLFALDWLWILATLIFDPGVKRGDTSFKTLIEWMFNDVVLVSAGVLIPTIGFLKQNQCAEWTFAGVGLLVFCADYYFNHKYYFSAPTVEEDQMTKLKRVVLESPYSGDVHANLEFAKRCIKDCLRRGEAPIASHLLFTQRGILNDNDAHERKAGIAAGHAWIEVAELVVVYVDRGVSEGMKEGIRAARRARINVEVRKLPEMDSETFDKYKKEVDELPT